MQVPLCCPCQQGEPFRSSQASADHKCKKDPRQGQQKQPQLSPAHTAGPQNTLLFRIHCLGCFATWSGLTQAVRLRSLMWHQRPTIVASVEPGLGLGG